MKIRAAGFDLGNTLIRYWKPMNWQSHYAPAFAEVCRACGLKSTAEKINRAGRIMSKYNTRTTPREKEVRDDEIFAEILTGWEADLCMAGTAKRAFFSYFKAGAKPYDDALPALKKIKALGLKTGLLTDVAYGMDNDLALGDIGPFGPYLDVCLTSVDIGYRKPDTRGYAELSRRLAVPMPEMLFVGDEGKDVDGANRAGMVSVLLDRDGIDADFGQRHTIHTMAELIRIIKEEGGEAS